MLLLVGCNGETTTPPQHGEAEALSGFIEIRGDRLYITPVKVFVGYNAGEQPGFTHDASLNSIIFIEWNDAQALEELGLTQYDFPSGYHIRPNWHSESHWHYVQQAGIETLSFEITNETEFTFFDTMLLFVEDTDGNRLHVTNNPDEFMQYFFPTAVHFIEVQDGRVVSLVQEFLFTM